jgi:ribonuclease P protein component
MPGELPAGGRLQFPQAQRIKHGWEFETLRREGNRITRGCLVLNWRPAPEEQASSRLGVITSRKVGSSVVRSRARRLLREVFRQHQHDFRRSVEMVLIARQSIAGKTYHEVERDFLTAARHAKLTREVA